MQNYARLDDELIALSGLLSCPSSSLDKQMKSDPGMET